MKKIALSWARIFWSAIENTWKSETSMMASAIAYFALFSLFPLMLLSISIAGYGFLPSLDQELIMRRLEFVTPGLGHLLGENIDQIIRARGTVSGAAFLGLIWSASSVFYSLAHAMDEIWNIKMRRGSWKWRGLALLLVLAIIGPALFFVSWAGTMASTLRDLIPPQILALRSGISFLVTIFLDVALFLLLYLILPRKRSTIVELLPGAVTAGLSWELAKKIFLSFVFTYVSISNLVYGTVAVIIAFLAWAYFSSLILLFGAYVNVGFWQSRHGQNV
jgi:membrane protein